MNELILQTPLKELFEYCVWKRINEPSYL